MQTHLNGVVSTGHCCLVMLSLPDRNEQKMKNLACMMTTLSGPRVLQLTFLGLLYHQSRPPEQPLCPFRSWNRR